MQLRVRLLALSRAVAVAGFLLPASAALAQADEAIEPIEQIVVVAHKDSRSIRDVAANVTVVSQEQLKNDLSLSIPDVFRYVPGVDHEAAGTRFGTEGVNVRGIGGNRVAILVDGVPLSDQFAVGSFSNATRDFLDTGIIRDIEVLHGPASALYGSAAIGGVVAVRTPDPADVSGAAGIGGDALASYRSSDESTHLQAMLALGDAEMGLLAGGSWREGEELDAAASEEQLDHRDTRRRTGLLKFVAKDAWGNTWRASAIQQRSDTTSALHSMLGSGRFRSTTALHGDDRYSMDMFNVTWEFDPQSRWVESGLVRVFHQDVDIRQATLDERGNARTPVSIDRFFAFEQDIRGIEVNLWREFSGRRSSHRLGFGAEYRERQTEEYRDGLSTELGTGVQTNVLLGEVFPLRDFPVSKTKELSAFIEDSWSHENWTLIAAVRADRFDLSPEVDRLYAEDYPFSSPVSIDEADLSPKLGLIYRLSSGTDLYLQYAHGFRAPPYAEANISLEVPFFNYRAIPNPELRSESSDGYDIGIRWHGLRSTARVSVFHTRYEDFIESKVRLGTDPVSGRTLFQSQNIEATVIEGVEAAWSFSQGAFEFDATAYYARGRNRVSDEPLNSVGPAQAVLGINWYAADGRRMLRLKTTLTDDWDDRDETRGELFKPAGYAVFDLLYSQALGERATLRAALHNLTDRTYWHWADVRGIAPDDPVLPSLSRAGRSASLSLNLTW